MSSGKRLTASRTNKYVLRPAGGGTFAMSRYRGSLRAYRSLSNALNTKYRSRSALLLKSAGKLFSGGGEFTGRAKPAIFGCETGHFVRVAATRQHPGKAQNDGQMILSGYARLIGMLLHQFRYPFVVCDVRRSNRGHF